jgi:hypothetical protein
VPALGESPAQLVGVPAGARAEDDDVHQGPLHQAIGELVNS